jgi:O-acetyl-ADP-ribose deacetylase (regulator of RNase III)
MLKHVDGNLLTLAEAGDFDVVIQGCNCFCAMGGGIAREIRERYPHVAAADAQTGLGDYNKLGNYSKAIVKGEDEHSFIIINAYTQYNMSTGDDVFEYVAFALILQKIERLYGNYSIGLPYIGMGLARGNSSIIMEMIEEFADAVEKKGGSVTLVQFV